MGVLVVTSAILMPVAGRLGDRYKRHAQIALVGLALMIPSLVIVAVTASIPGLLFGLALMGLGVGFMSPSLLALVGQSVSENYRGRAVSVLQLCGDLGGTLGPLVGTLLLTNSLSTPYLATAIILAIFFPIAVHNFAADSLRRNE
jgi:MFS family permease